MQHLKQYRMDHRLSQKEIRVQNGASASAYSKLENGQRSAKLEEVFDIISALDLPAIELIYWLSDSGVHFRELKGKDPHHYATVLAALKENICSLEIKHAGGDM